MKIKSFGINKDIGNADVEVYLHEKFKDCLFKDCLFHIDGRMTDIKRAKKLVRSLQKAIEYVESNSRGTMKGVRV